MFPGQGNCLTTLSFIQLDRCSTRLTPQGSNDELKQAVSSALKEADNRMNKSVVMPLISCGVYGFPADKAAMIISDTVVNFLERSTHVKEVYIVNGDKAKLDITLAALIQNSGVNVVQKPSSTSGKIYISCSLTFSVFFSLKA